MEIVLQGPLDDFAMHIAEFYLQCDFIKKVIISCWENDPEIPIRDSRIIVLRSPDVENPSVGNRNRQIKSSQVGLSAVEDKLCAKLRTDQEISIPSMYMLKAFFEKFKESELRFEDNQGPLGKVCVASLFKVYPFHPRDHIFWGYTEDVKKVFDIPLCSLLTYPTTHDGQYINHTRAETYIASYYYAKFNKRIYDFIREPNVYLTDWAPQRAEAMDIYLSLWDKVFQPFPAIDMRIAKQNYGPYHYHYGPHGEVWYDKEWK